MNKGDLIFVKNNGYIYKKIREATNCPFNHVGIFVNDKETVDALFKGVVKTPFCEIEKKQKEGKLEYQIFRVKNIRKGQIDRVVSFVEKQVGRKYDYIQFLSLWFFLFFHINRRIEPIDIRFAWICSELVAEAFYPVGVIFSATVDPDNHTPADILYSKEIYRVA